MPRLPSGANLPASTTACASACVFTCGTTNALRATIERPVDGGIVVVHDAHDRRHAPEVARAGQVTEIGVVDTAVLAFQPDAVGADRAQLIDQVGIVG